MSSSACGASDTGHRNFGVIWSLAFLALVLGGSESAIPHFPYLCACWALAEVRDHRQGMAVTLPYCPRPPSPIKGGRDPFVLPALFLLKILVVGPSPGQQLLN